MSDSVPSKPRVVVLSPDVNSSFTLCNYRFLGKLEAVATVEHIKYLESIGQILSGQHPQAILVTDGAITRYHDVISLLLDYVRGGGILILMGNFSSTIRPSELQKFFRDVGQPWATADYMRTIVHRTDAADVSSQFPLPSSYSQKAVFLANVSDDDAWYLPNKTSYTQSFVFPSERVQNLEQTPIALAKIGNGKLGYVGDVNGEPGSDAVVLTMCGFHYVV